jgi:2-dehydro-3-deoxygluconokinase
MKRIITFGEIMMRIAPKGHLRFKQCLPGEVDITFSGAEANVAASIAILGGRASFVSALPNHTIADTCIALLKGLDVDTNYILRSNHGRLGIYFLETGANQRPSNVIYDRESSTIFQTKYIEFPWDEIFSNAIWFHISGITPALSAVAAETCLYAVQKAKELNIQVSCDLNYRKKLWQWDSSKSPKELAQITMRKILPFVDLIIGNEEDASDILDIHAGESDASKGLLDIKNYKNVAIQIINQFPNISQVAITLRESISATHNNWGAMLYNAKNNSFVFAPSDNSGYAPYQIHHIIDRVGGGDSFAAGLIFALNTPELSEQSKAIFFAVAASCLAHSIKGDFNFSTRSEVEALMNGASSGRVVR